jgi:Uma2 family endonuclease
MAMTAPLLPPEELPSLGWTAARVRRLPDDGIRYECVDGELFMTPAPVSRHQRVVGDLSFILHAYVQRHTLGEVWTSPADIELDRRTLVQPDIFVTPYARDITRTWTALRDFRLIVEVRSPSTARADRTVKRERYQRYRMPNYCVVDTEANAVEWWTPDDAAPVVHTEWLSRAPELEVAPLTVHLPTFFDLGLAEPMGPDQ